MNDYTPEMKVSIHDLEFFGAAAEQILCRPAETYEVAKYQVEIMASRAEHFIQPDWIQENEQDYLLYNKQGFISLEHYFLKQSAERADIFHCLRQMLLSLQLCRDILLDTRQLILDARFIFLKKLSYGSEQVSGFDPYFIYVPAEAKAAEPIPDAQASLLARIVEFFIKEGEKKNLFLEEEIDLMRRYVMGDIERMLAWLDEKIRYPDKPKRRKLPAGKKSNKTKAKSSQSISPISSEEKQRMSRFNQASLTKIIIIVDIVLLFLLNFSLRLAIKSQAPLYYALTAVGLFILITSDVYLLQINGKENHSETRFERERRHKELREYETKEDIKQTAAPFEAGVKRDDEMNHFSIAYLYPVTNENIANPDIEAVTEHSRASAVILNREFYIGNDRDRCDFSPQTLDISPLHARISKQDNSYLLTDLASESGTYLNNLRLHYYEDYVLFSGAYIRFNDLTYLFVIEEADAMKQGA